MAAPSEKQEFEFSIESRKPKVRKSEQLWLMTFSDLSFVLLCFFVLLFSFSKTDTKKFDNVRSGMTAKTSDVKQEKKPDNLKTIEKEIEKVIKKNKLYKVVNVSYGADGVAVEFRDKALFASGSARVSKTNRKVVEGVLKVIASASKNYNLVIEGHTDDVPMRSRRFQSNWDLSAARGVSMLNQFAAKGVPAERMAVEAYAHTRPKVKIKGKKGGELVAARAQNRRVVIRIR